MTVESHASFHQLVSSNGFTATIYDEQKARLTGFREHIYAAVDAGAKVRELACDAYFGLRLNGRGTWLTDAAAPRVRYLPATGIIEASQKIGSVEATSYLFAPFEVAAPAAVLLLEIKNTGRVALGPDAAACSLHNFRVGEGSDATRDQRIDWDEKRGLFTLRHAVPSGRVMVFLPLCEPSHYGCSPDNPWTRLRDGRDLADDEGSGTIDEAVSGFQWSLADLAAGETRWVGVAFAYHPFGDDAAIATALRDWLDGREISTLVSDESARWVAWHQRTVEPTRLSRDERALFRQQVSLLRMGQVREPDDAAHDYLPHGQIVASLPPGTWNICWVRDAMVAISALIKSDHTDEARDALEFFLKARAGIYQSHVALPYQISVVRYFGKGLEESDWNQDGPNIEWDGFGMFLDGLDAYERATGDRTLADAHWPSVCARIADVIVSLATDDGLLRADSSIWESHWDNGARQHWTWSQIWGVVGLRAAAAMAARRAQPNLAEKWSQTAATIRDAIKTRLVDREGFLRGRLEATPTPVDAAVVEAFNRSVLDASCARPTLSRIVSELRVASGHGFRRSLVPGKYDAREWIFVDLRVATLMRATGDAAGADALIDWVTAQSRANHDLIAENYHPIHADYLGATPMIGFGAGAYVLALFDRDEGAGT